ncbi:MAG: Maf family protein, partial [Planctomycetes bacterium]|nr:Maf family protein [Planctomycetota bacterium]
MLGRRIVLASASPYRKKLLMDAGVECIVLPSNVDESLQPKIKPEAYARELAVRKAQATAPRCGDALVIGADTICAIGDEIIGKPADEADAERMLVRACESGLQRVISGIAVIDTRDMTTRSAAITSLVEMRDTPI